MAKTVTMTSSLGEREFDLAEAQRILTWQKMHPTIKDRWTLKGQEYTYDDVTNELVKRTNKGADKQSKASE
jgi:hypothetical protein